jgi:hypothetical protein
VVPSGAFTPLSARLSPHTQTTPLLTQSLTNKQTITTHKQKKQASGTFKAAAPEQPVAAAVTPAGALKPVSFGDLMAFSGPAPEVVNGRLAMLAVVAALGAEFASGESVLRQLKDEPTGVMLAFALVIAASFAPLLQNVKPASETFGPFNAKAEMLNGRAAMLGFAALIVIEAVKGSALF